MHRIVGGIVLGFLAILGFVIVSGMLLALAGGINGHDMWKAVGGAMVMFGIAPILLLFFTEIGQAIVSLSPLDLRRKKQAKERNDA